MRAAAAIEMLRRDDALSQELIAKRPAPPIPPLRAPTTHGYAAVPTAPRPPGAGSRPATGSTASTLCNCLRVRIATRCCRPTAGRLATLSHEKAFRALFHRQSGSRRAIRLVPALALTVHKPTPGRSGDMGTPVRSTETPAEAPDSLTPRSEWARPIDPDAADRRRYGRPDGAASPDLFLVRRSGDQWPLLGRNPERWLPDVGEPRRIVGSPPATRWSGPVARTPCGRRAVGRRASRPAA
jgi:hypothetical protein